MLITSVTKATNVNDWQIRGIPIANHSFDNFDYESLSDEEKSKISFNDSGEIFKTLYENLPGQTFQKLIDRFVTYNRTINEGR